MIDVPAEEGRLSVLLGEAIKLPAFARRDMIVAFSYRFAFFSDAFSLVLQAFLFYFVGLAYDNVSEVALLVVFIGGLESVLHTMRRFVPRLAAVA